MSTRRVSSLAAGQSGSAPSWRPRSGSSRSMRLTRLQSGGVSRCGGRHRGQLKHSSRLASPDIAKKYGAHPIDPSAGDPAETLRSLTSSRGPDAVLEVVGNPAALNLALQLVRTCGVVSSCGVHNHQLQIEGDVAYGKGFRLQFGRCHARAMFAESLELLKKISRETPDLIDGFVQKKVKLEEAVEVGPLEF